MTNDTLTLAEFLLARIAEDEANLPTLAGMSPDEFVDGSATARWGERVFAECEAKRRIVEEHEPNPEGSARGRLCQTCDTAGGAYPCYTVLHLAAVYADHPDYRGGEGMNPLSQTVAR